MNVSQYVIRYPYQIVWHLNKIFRKNTRVDFFCGNIVDYICFKNIHALMPEINIIAKNSKVKKQLLEYGINASVYPSFPDVIIMARHLARKYPEKRIIKIGMRHGAYHFKNFVNKDRYNAFDRFLVTSSKEVNDARQAGITSAVAVGFPKIDSAFNGKEENIKTVELALENKPTLIFSATWDENRYSAIDHWCHRLGELTNDYNVLVTVHPWTSQHKIDQIKRTEQVHYIDDKDILPYLMMADLMVGDTSSIIGEFCALDKPIITFDLPSAGRVTDETRHMLENISFRVKSFKALKDILPTALANPNKHKAQRDYYNKVMFDQLDGKASERAVKIIRGLIEVRS